MKLLPRFASKSLIRAAAVIPVVGVTGARQTGKSTLVRDLCPPGERFYLTLDDLDTLGQARSGPGRPRSARPPYYVGRGTNGNRTFSSRSNGLVDRRQDAGRLELLNGLPLAKRLRQEFGRRRIVQEEVVLPSNHF